MFSTYFLIEFNKWITCIEVGKKMNICTLGYISVGTLSSFIVLLCASDTCVPLFYHSTHLTSHTLIKDSINYRTATATLYTL